MKVSMSLPDEDVRLVDEYVARGEASSRSAAIQRAIALLRNSELAEAYEQAWNEWDAGDDAGLWDETTADGLADASR